MTWDRGIAAVVPAEVRAESASPTIAQQARYATLMARALEGRRQRDEALGEILGDQLWKVDGHADEDAFLATEWPDVNKSYVDQLRRRAKVSEAVGEVVPVGVSNPLSRLPAEEQRDAYDEALALAKAEGVAPREAARAVVNRRLGVPDGAKVTVEEGDAGGDTPESIADERAEQKAKEATELTDEEWLGRFEIRGSLNERTRRKFDKTALLWRDLDPLRRSLAHGSAPLLKRYGDDAKPLAFYVRLLLRLGDPSRWPICHPVEKGGCGGQGTVPMVGECPECHGAGFRVK
jgi:hypothetical protein